MCKRSIAMAAVVSAVLGGSASGRAEENFRWEDYRLEGMSQEDPRSEFLSLRALEVMLRNQDWIGACRVSAANYRAVERAVLGDEERLDFRVRAAGDEWSERLTVGLEERGASSDHHLIKRNYATARGLEDEELVELYYTGEAPGLLRRSRYIFAFQVNRAGELRYAAGYRIPLRLACAVPVVCVEGEWEPDYDEAELLYQCSDPGFSVSHLLTPNLRLESYALR